MTILTVLLVKVTNLSDGAMGHDEADPYVKVSSHYATISYFVFSPVLRLVASATQRPAFLHAAHNWR